MALNTFKKIKTEKNENPLNIYDSNTSFVFSNLLILINNEIDNFLFIGESEHIDYLIIQEFKKLHISDIIIFSRGARFCVYVCKDGVFNLSANLSIINNQIEQLSLQRIDFFQNPEEIISLCCGYEFCVCICKTGVFGWGNNWHGQLGIGTNCNSQSSPQQILFFKNPEDIISLFCGIQFCVCICKNGVFSWGDNRRGQLGIGNQLDQFSPQQILFFKNPEDIISLSCGYEFCVCICKNGIFSWGDNIYGQLGIGNEIDQSYPQQINFFKNPEEIISLSCGGNFCICICKNGVCSWGSNHSGQLGIGNKIKSQSFPQSIPFFKNPEEIISLVCGSKICICICKERIYRWGYEEPFESGNERNSFQPRTEFLKENIESFSKLSFLPSSTIQIRRFKKLLLLLAREYLNPEEYLMGKDYLPRDLFYTIMNLF